MARQGMARQGMAWFINKKGSNILAFKTIRKKNAGSGERSSLV